MSAHRFSPRSFDTVGGELGGVLCLRRGAGRFRVRMMWYHPGFVIAVGRAACSLLRLFSPGCPFASPGCLPRSQSFAYLVRFPYVSAFAPAISPRAIGVAPPLVSNKTGSKTGRDFTHVLDLPLGNVSACDDSDVDVDERGRRGVLPVLFLLCLISFNRSASLNSNSSPLPLSSALVGLLA